MAKFCSNCGAELNEEQEILEVEADIMAANLLKKFKSSSGNNE